MKHYGTYTGEGAYKHVKWTIISLRIVAVFFTIVHLIFLALSINSMSNSHVPSIDTFFVRLDFENINFNTVYNTTLDVGSFQDAEDAVGLQRYLRIGFLGNAFVSENGTLVEYESSTGSMTNLPNTLRTNRYFVRYAAYLEGQNSVSAGTLSNTAFVLPPGLPSTGVMNSKFKAGFALLVTAVAFTGIALILFFISFVKPASFSILFGTGGLVEWISYILTTCGAAVLTNIGRSVRSSYNDAYTEFGIRASWGNGRLYAFAWCAFVFALIVVMGFCFQLYIVNFVLRKTGKKYGVMKADQQSWVPFLNPPTYLEPDVQHYGTGPEQEKFDDDPVRTFSPSENTI